MSATPTKSEIRRALAFVERARIRTTRLCLDCQAEIPASRWRCETCAEEPDTRNGHTGICAVPGCGADVSPADYWCSQCAEESRADEAADMRHDARWDEP